jgi:hypothetical protein
VLAALAAGVVSTVACGSFDATTPDALAEAGLPEGAATDASLDGGEATDAAPDAALGDGAQAPLAVAQESSKTQYVATDAKYIYWWSTSQSAILRADKDHLTAIDTVAARSGEALNALAVDGSGVYWLEAGPDPVQYGSRIMQLERPFSAGNVPTVLFRTPDPLSRLALDSTRALSTFSSGVVGATKTGTPINFGLGIDGRSLTSDDTNAFYSFAYAYVFRVGASGNSTRVISVPAPRELIVEGSALYGVMDVDAGSAIFKTDKTESDALVAAAVQLVQLPASTVFLAIDNLGLVWGNASDGSIHRVGRSGGTPTDVASAIVGMNAIAADERGVYWSTDTGAVGWATR